MPNDGGKSKVIYNKPVNWHGAAWDRPMGFAYGGNRKYTDGWEEAFGKRQTMEERAEEYVENASKLLNDPDCCVAHGVKLGRLWNAYCWTCGVGLILIINAIMVVIAIKECA